MKTYPIDHSLEHHLEIKHHVLGVYIVCRECGRRWGSNLTAPFYIAWCVIIALLPIKPLVERLTTSLPPALNSGSAQSILQIILYVAFFFILLQIFNFVHAFILRRCKNLTAFLGSQW